MTRHNACPNPALANDATGWSTDGTGGRTAVTGFSRPFGMQVTSAVFIQSARADVGAGQTWTLSCELRATASGTISVYVDRFRSDNSSMGGVGPTNLPASANVVTTLSTTITTPADCAFIALTPVLPASTVTYAVTAVLIEQVASPDTYADGDSPGWEWDGTAGSSTSSESTAIPLTLADSPTAAATGGPVETLQLGLVLADTALAASSSGQPETLQIGLGLADTAAAATLGGPAGQVALGLTHTDQAAAAHATGPAGTLLIGADLTLVDTPTAARAAATTDALALSPPYSWPPRARSVTVRRVAHGTVSIR